MRTIEVDLSNAEEIARWKSGADGYVASLPDWGRYYLYTKPFATVAGPIGPEHTAYFHDFANILQILNLPPGSRILDAACGPGWLSEFLWRFGYDVTGADVCEPLLAIARERVTRVFPPWQRTTDSVRFVHLDIETEHLDDRFDAILFYDCLHHFSDVTGIFRQIDEMLAPDGCVLIKEGVMPPRGSVTEQNLLAESKRSSTLESPYEHDWLEKFLRDRGFASVRAFVELNGLFEKNSRTRDQVCALFDAPHAMNIFLCHREVPGNTRAVLCIESWSLEESGDVRIVVRAVNDGAAIWRADPELRAGSVALGIRVEDDEGNTIEEFLGRTPLPHDVAPNQSVVLSLLYPLSQVSHPGIGRIVVDLVAQGAFWFGERGSEVLTPPLPR